MTNVSVAALSVLFGILVSISHPTGTGMTEVTIHADVDAQIHQQAPDTNYGGSATALVGTTDPSPDKVYRAIMTFDVGSIPDNATINSATLRLYVEDVVADFAVSNAYVRRMTQSAWEESEVTWNEYSNGNGWTSSGGGGDFSTTDQVTFNIGAGDFEADADGDIGGLADLVEDAIDNRNGELHLIIMQETEGDSPQTWFEFSTTEASGGGSTVIPRLIVDYTTS